jgi:UDP-N-acetylmuramate dehydrogenase
MLIQENISLKDYNTFHVDVNAKFFVKIKDEDDIMKLIKDDKWRDNKKFIL